MNAKGQATTLTEIEAIEKNMLTPADVCAFLGVDKFSINCASKNGTLPWAIQMGSRTIISKEAFLHWSKYGYLPVEKSHCPHCGILKGDSINGRKAKNIL